MRLPDKKAIQSAFDRAAHSYHQAAEVQKRICHQLLDGLLPTQSNQKHLHILDAGCGTGYGNQLLAERFSTAKITQLDLSTAMLQHAALGNKVCADMEHLPLMTGCMDVYWSSLSVQWCDLASVLTEAKRVLGSGGTLALATLGSETFHELRTAFQGIDDQPHTLDFVPPQMVEQTALGAGFAAVEVLCHMETTYHPNLRALLHSIKAVGANQLPNPKQGQSRRLTRVSLTKLETAYEAMRTESGLPLSYQVIRLYAHL